MITKNSVYHSIGYPGCTEHILTTYSPPSDTLWLIYIIYINGYTSLTLGLSSIFSSVSLNSFTLLHKWPLVKGKSLQSECFTFPLLSLDCISNKRICSSDCAVWFTVYSWSAAISAYFVSGWSSMGDRNFVSYGSGPIILKMTGRNTSPWNNPNITTEVNIWNSKTKNRYNPFPLKICLVIY